MKKQSHQKVHVLLWQCLSHFPDLGSKQTENIQTKFSFQNTGDVFPFFYLKKPTELYTTQVVIQAEFSIWCELSNAMRH